MPSLAEISMRLTRLAIVTAPALFVLFVEHRVYWRTLWPAGYRAVDFSGRADGFRRADYGRDRDNRGRCEVAIVNLRTISTGYGHIIKERSRNELVFGPKLDPNCFQSVPRIAFDILPMILAALVSAPFVRFA